MLIGTPALWWPAIPVLAWGLWRAVTRGDWRWVAVLVGYGAGILPWFLNLDRQMYFFYMTPVAPFLVLATVLVMGEMLGRSGVPERRRRIGLMIVVRLGGAGHRQLRVAVADPGRQPDHRGALAGRAVAAVLAVKINTADMSYMAAGP